MEQAKKKAEDTMIQDQVGAMENELFSAQTAIAEMVRIASDDAPPDVERTNRVIRHKTNATNSVIRTVEKALAVAGGAAYFRGMGLERRFRDIQAARYHPIQEPKQHRFSGRVALGLNPMA